MKSLMCKLCHAIKPKMMMHLLKEKNLGQSADVGMILYLLFMGRKNDKEILFYDECLVTHII